MSGNLFGIGSGYNTAGDKRYNAMGRGHLTRYEPLHWTDHMRSPLHRFRCLLYELHAAHHSATHVEDFLQSTLVQT